MKRHAITNFLFSLSSVITTALWCSYYNEFAMKNYYDSLSKPFLTPPNAVFPITWTILYVLLIIAFDVILNLADKKKSFAVKIFITSMALQILWSYVFFYKGMFLVGFAVIIIKCFVAAVLLNEFYRLNKTAGVILIPYLVWLLFATYLNWEIADLNGAALT